MKKGLSIFLAIIIVMIIITVAGIFTFKKQYKELLKDINREYTLIEKIDMTNIQDGEYNYRFGKIPVLVDLKVNVKDHAIKSITIKEQSSGPGYEALETIDRILSKQDVKVDAVSGATTSSKVIMIATYKALEKRDS
ncbi:MAG: FMN-binding protein [Candidatus Neomarinimicrobiota bacterium]|nr:MAG: FMN-binding protein [Candidatus Neomarinimicrobiota bacterium]